MPLVDKAKLGTDVIVRLSGLRRERLLAEELDESILESHLLDRRSIELLKAEDFEEFRHRRKGILQRYFETFVNDRIGDTADLRPSIKTIAEGATGNRTGVLSQ